MVRTFWDDLMQEVGEEEIEAVCIGEARGGFKYSWSVEEPHPANELLDAEAAFMVLNYEYDSGYGAVDCHAVYVWTPTKVIFVTQYDGSTSITSVPRHPMAIEPQIPGG